MGVEPRGGACEQPLGLCCSGEGRRGWGLGLREDVRGWDCPKPRGGARAGDEVPSRGCMNGELFVGNTAQVPPSRRTFFPPGPGTPAEANAIKAKSWRLGWRRARGGARGHSASGARDPLRWRTHSRLEGEKKRGGLSVSMSLMQIRCEPLC